MYSASSLLKQQSLGAFINLTNNRMYEIEI